MAMHGCHTTFYVSICSNGQFISINIHCPIVCIAFATSVGVVACCTEGVIKAVYDGIENYRKALFFREL